MVEQSLKEVVKAMCKEYPGGREAMAGALGMTITQFNNNLYEKNGCRFFEVAELEAMEDISGTSELADYFAKRRGALLVDTVNMPPHPFIRPAFDVRQEQATEVAIRRMNQAIDEALSK